MDKKFQDGTNRNKSTTRISTTNGDETAGSAPPASVKAMFLILTLGKLLKLSIGNGVKSLS